MFLKKHLWQASIILQEKASIHPGTIIYGKGTLTLKKGAKIEEGCTISLGNNGQIEIGINTIIRQSIIETTNYSIINWSHDDENKNGKIKIGNNVSINPFSLLLADLGGSITVGANTILYGSFIETNGGRVNIGKNCLIKQRVVINGAGNTKIGEGVTLNDSCVLFASNHAFSNRSIEMNRQGTTTKGIMIEKDVVVGSGAKILDGVTIPKGCRIEDFSVVTKKITQKGIYGGNPFKLLQPLE